MKSKSKTILWGIALLLLILLFTGCDYDRFNGRRPPDYPNTKWICTNYPMYFYVTADHITQGVIQSGNSEFGFGFLWPLGTSGVDICVPDSQGRGIANGRCLFGERWFTIIITNDHKGYFENGQILIFQRIDLPDKTSEMEKAVLP